MTHLDDLARQGGETRRHRRLLYTCQATAGLLLAGLFGSLPGLVAMAAIAGTALALMVVQHFIARRLGNKAAT